MFPASQTTICRQLEEFVENIVHLLTRFVTFPSNQDELNAKKMVFNRLSGLPNVVGAIDCTHIKIQRPMVNDWFVYLNRKSDFTINVQLVCDYNLVISDAVVRWPGSTHDAFIWKHSGLRHNYVTGRHADSYLVGDSGYPLEPWLMRPFATCSTAVQAFFNDQLTKARNCIERCNGVLKSRFRCLHPTGGVLSYLPGKTCKIITACIILHNICVLHKVECPDDVMMMMMILILRMKKEIF